MVQLDLPVFLQPLQLVLQPAASRCVRLMARAYCPVLYIHQFGHLIVQRNDMHFVLQVRCCRCRYVRGVLRGRCHQCREGHAVRFESRGRYFNKCLKMNKTRTFMHSLKEQKECIKNKRFKHCVAGDYLASSPGPVLLKLRGENRAW